MKRTKKIHKPKVIHIRKLSAEEMQTLNKMIKLHSSIIKMADVWCKENVCVCVCFLNCVANGTFFTLSIVLSVLNLFSWHTVVHGIM